MSSHNKDTTKKGLPRPTSIIDQPKQQHRSTSNEILSSPRAPTKSMSQPPISSSPQHKTLPDLMPQRPPSLMTSSLSERLSSFSPSLAPPPPRRLWAINDTSLRPVPRFYPKMDPKCTVYISDASPSVIAVRISECLRKRSISVEYDEEAVIATCMTVDRCHFVIRLYQGAGKNQPPLLGIDFSHGVVVEVMRVTGSVLTFHRHCRSILQAAKGHSTGEDRRPSYRTSVLEFRRLKAGRKQNADMNLIQRDRASISAAHALEQARELLKKDRLDCQQLGMERLVGLTSTEVSGEDISSYVSLQLLQDLWLTDYLKEGPYGEDLDDKTATGTNLMTACAATLFDGDAGASPSCLGPRKMEEEARHDGVLRASALRVLTNALSVVAADKMLDRLMCRKDSPLVGRNLLDILIRNLSGATRPPSVVMAGSSLSSVHEAALATRCLRILGEHSEECQDYLQTEHVLERLETARACGRSTHWVLQSEAESTYSKLTEDVRSC